MENLDKLYEELKEIKAELPGLQEKSASAEPMTEEELSRLEFLEKRHHEISAKLEKVFKRNPSRILEKKHPIGGGVKIASNKLALVGLGIVGVTGMLLGLNAVSTWAQNFSLFGQAWGPIFGLGTNHAINGIVSASLEAAKWVGGVALVGTTVDGITHAVKYSKYKTADINSVSDEKITDYLFEKVLVTTDSNVSIFEQLKQARKEYANAKGIFERREKYRKMTALNNYINKSMKRLGDRLNQLSIDVRNSDEFTTSELIYKYNEMEKIQKLFMAVLDKEDASDAHFKTFKNIIKKHKSTINISSAFTSNHFDTISQEEKEIVFALESGDINKAIKCFCTHAKNFSMDDILSLYPLYEEFAKKKEFVKRASGVDEITSQVATAVKLTEGIKTTKTQADHIKQIIDGLAIETTDLTEKTRGSYNRTKMYEKWCKELYEKGMTRESQIKAFIISMDQVRDILRENVTPASVREAKELLIKNLKEQKCETQVIKDSLYFVDYIANAFNAKNVRKAQSAAIKNVEEKTNLINEASKKVTTRAGEAITEIGSAEKTVTDIAGKTVEEINTTSTNAKRHIKHAENEAELAALLATLNADETEKQKARAKDAADKAEQEQARAKAAADKAEASLASIEKKIARLKAIKVDDVTKINSLLEHLFESIAELKGEQSKFASYMNVEACYELLGREIDSLRRALIDYNIDDLSGRVANLVASLDALKKNHKQTKSKVTKLENSYKETKAKVAEIDERTAKIIENINSLRNRVISDEKLLDVIEKTSVSKSDFRKIQKTLATHQNDTRKLEEIVCWLEKNVDELTKENKVLSSQLVELVEQIYSVESDQTKLKEELNPAKEPPFKYGESEEHDKLVKMAKNYLHAIHRALKDGKPLPEVLPTSMRGKKQTQSEIAEQGGKNLDFSVGSKFRNRVNSLCEKYLKGRELKYSQEFAVHELSEFNEEQLHAYINLIQKACIAYNNDHQTGGPTF